VELMGGEIGFESRPEEGSTFHFTLRLPSCDPAGNLDMPAGLAGKRVLVVDHDADGRAIIAGYLTQAGMVAAQAASAAQALRCLGEAAFDLALLDDQFPDMDGWLLSELIRFDDDWNEMRVMLMSTANLQGNDGTTAVDGCLVKPVVPEVLLDEVAALLGVIEGPRRARMPIAQMAAQPKDGIAPRPVERQSECAPAHDAEFRVLLAEDNLVNQEVAVRMLSQLG
jgi:CheY-like chemotaxis protein